MFLNDILGHERTIANLRQVLEQDRINTAYLFCGPEGVGGKSLLYAFAATLLCLENGLDACGKCPSCRLLISSSHPDLVELIPEKNDISVNEMRCFCQAISIKSTVSNRRVCLVPQADHLTQGVANSFLKTLEEPPGKAIVLLRAQSTESLLRTIVSRCQVIHLAPLAKEIVSSYLGKQGFPRQEAEAAALFSEGSLSKALQLCTGEANKHYKWLKQKLDNPHQKDALPLAEGLIESTASLAKAQGSKSLAALELVDMMALILRPGLRDAATASQTLVQLEQLWQAAVRLRKNVNSELVLRTLALGICQS